MSACAGWMAWPRAVCCETRHAQRIFPSCCWPIDSAGNIAWRHSRRARSTTSWKPYDRVDVLARIQAHLHHYANLGARQRGELEQEPSEDELLVQMTMWYLNERMALPPTNKQLAQRMGVSEGRLSRAFTLAYGKSLRATLPDARLTKARQLLAENRLSIAQIAGFLGYANTAGFSTAFRQRWGLSPSAARSRVAKRGARRAPRDATPCTLGAMTPVARGQSLRIGTRSPIVALTPLVPLFPIRCWPSSSPYRDSFGVIMPVAPTPTCTALPDRPVWNEVLLSFASGVSFQVCSRLTLA